MTRTRDYMTIGELVENLQPAHPDLSISKIRFLEDEGLVTPERTAGGYRKFSAQDAARVDLVLRLQKEHFLPLAVIRDKLKDLDKGRVPEELRPMVTRPEAVALPFDEVEAVPLEQIQSNMGLATTFIRELAEFGLVRIVKGDHGEELRRADIEVAHAAWDLRKFGVEPRHLRMYITAAEREAWDGDWYRRAYFDDGTPLGSVTNSECRIDSIAQSWSVLSGAANPHRAEYAMESVNRLLVRESDQIVLLLEPPFDKTRRTPGYIKAYPPGVRENGGQYTHAAAWVAWAFAKLGKGDQAEELFHMLNPIHHSDDPKKLDRYKVEPYVQAADIYSIDPYIGMGGWTWYTGSAGWMYRLGVEAILGLTREGSYLVIDPCIPAHWKEYSLVYRLGKTIYQIQVQNPEGLQRGISQVSLDGELQPGNRIRLVDDQHTHAVQITLGTQTVRERARKVESGK